MTKIFPNFNLDIFSNFISDGISDGNKTKISDDISDEEMSCMETIEKE